MARLPFQYLVPGVPLTNVPAEEYNAFIDRARAERAQPQVPPRFLEYAFVARCKNVSGETLQKTSIVQLGDPLVLPNTDSTGEAIQQHNDFKTRIGFHGELPTAEIGHLGVAVSYMENNRNGDIVVGGFVAALINVINESDTAVTFDLTAGQEHLRVKSTPNDPSIASIVYKESGTGEKWGIIFIPGAGGGGDQDCIEMTAACIDDVTVVDTACVKQVRRDNMLRLVEDSGLIGTLDFDPGPIENALLNAIGPLDENGEASLVWTNVPKVRSLEVCENIRIACDPSTLVDSDVVTIDDDVVAADEDWDQGYSIRSSRIAPPTSAPVDSSYINADDSIIGVDAGEGEFDSPYVDEQYFYAPPVPAVPGGVLYARTVGVGARERHVQTDFLVPGVTGSVEVNSGTEMETTLIFLHGVLIAADGDAFAGGGSSTYGMPPIPDPNPCICPDPEVYSPCDPAELGGDCHICEVDQPGPHTYFPIGWKLYCVANGHAAGLYDESVPFFPNTITLRANVTISFDPLQLNETIGGVAVRTRLAPQQGSIAWYISVLPGDDIDAPGEYHMNLEVISSIPDATFTIRIPIEYVDGAEVRMQFTRAAGDQYDQEYYYDGVLIYTRSSDLFWYDPLSMGMRSNDSLIELPGFNRTVITNFIGAIGSSACPT